MLSALKTLALAPVVLVLAVAFLAGAGAVLAILAVGVLVHVLVDGFLKATQSAF
jgi:hypothetical protein